MRLRRNPEMVNLVGGINTILLTLQAAFFWADPPSDLPAWDVLQSITDDWTVWASIATVLAVLSIATRLLALGGLLGGPPSIAWWAFLSVGWIGSLPSTIGSYLMLAWTVIYAREYVRWRSRLH